eukprot:COSAG02_NODE_22933_length_735_cov_1.305031_1_plen_213_part_00
MQHSKVTIQSVVDESEPCRIVFLDVDGVLHPIGEPPYMVPLAADWDDLCARADEVEARGDEPEYVTRICNGEFLDPCMAALKRAVETANASIVLSTTWRKRAADRRAVLQQLARYGLAERVIGDTPDGGARGHECRQWIEEHREKQDVDALQQLEFVVLDDDDEGVLAGGHIPATRFVKIRRATGMTEADADAAISALSTPSANVDEDGGAG